MPSAQRQRRFDGDAVKRHSKIAARKTVAAYVASNGRLAAQALVDLLPVELLGMGGGDERFSEDLPVEVLRACAGGKRGREN
jgi:hypothetical protein